MYTAGSIEAYSSYTSWVGLLDLGSRSHLLHGVALAELDEGRVAATTPTVPEVQTGHTSARQHVSTSARQHAPERTA